MEHFLSADHDHLSTAVMETIATMFQEFGAANWVAIIACAWGQLSQWSEVLSKHKLYVHTNRFVSYCTPTNIVREKCWTPKNAVTDWV